MSSTDCLIRLPIWASHLEALVGGKKERKAFIPKGTALSNGHTLAIVYQQAPHRRTRPGVPLPPPVPRGFSPFMQQSQFSRGFTVCLQYLCIPGYTKTRPKRHICSTRRGSSPRVPPGGQAGPHSPLPEGPGEDQEHHAHGAEPGTGLKADPGGSACPKPCPSLQLELEKRFCSLERSYFPHSIY